MNYIENNVKQQTNLIMIDNEDQWKSLMEEKGATFANDPSVVIVPGNWIMEVDDKEVQILYYPAKNVIFACGDSGVMFDGDNADFAESLL